MAVRKIAMVVNLRQNKNESSTYFGKWYPEVDTKQPLDLKGFCAHMTEHGKLADYQMVVLVVQQVVEVILLLFPPTMGMSRTTVIKECAGRRHSLSEK